MVFEEALVLPMSFDDAVPAVKAAFAAEGFGTLTEVDLQSTLHAKSGKEIDRYVIIGACNPDLAGRALDAEPSIGVLLPCNVVVRESGADVVVEALDPGIMATLVGTDVVRTIADEARRRVGNALARLGAAD
jgi:uncharacterized protein (DUF302 family)